MDNKIDNLFAAIENSKEYKNYLSIGKSLKKDTKINELIEEIKKLQKESTRLEYNNDDSYKEVDALIESKVKELNSIPAYIEYLNKIDSPKTINHHLKKQIKLIKDIGGNYD